MSKKTVRVMAYFCLFACLLPTQRPLLQLGNAFFGTMAVALLIQNREPREKP